MPETPQTPELAEQQIVSQMKVLEELLETKGWKNYEAVLRIQLAERYKLLRTPLSEVNGPDGLTRVAVLETVKGAIIGLELALSLPRNTIEHGKQILADRAAAAGKDKEEDSQND